MITPVIGISIVFWTLLIVVAALFLKTPRFKESLLLNYKPILVLLVVAILAKFPFYGHYFFGLEYEDSYIFNVFARSLLYIQDFSFSTFATKSCIIGSLSNCHSLASFASHFITFPSVIYSIFRLIGYSPYTILYINLLCSLFSVVLVFLIARIMVNDNKYAIISAGIFALTPIINIFHTSGLSETFSSTWILLFLYLFLSKYSQGMANHRNKYLFWVSISFSLVIVTLTKRENSLIFLIPVVLIIIEFIKNKAFYIKEPLSLVPIFILIVLILFYYYYINVISIEAIEQIDMGHPSFNIKYLIATFPVYVKSFFTFKWFTIFSCFTVLGIIFILIEMRKYLNFLYLIVLFFGFLFLYLLHYRSYYFVNYGKINEFETLRYITNFFPLYCLLSGFGIFRFYEYLISRHLKSVLFLNRVIFPIIIFLLIFQSQKLKYIFSEIELKERILPVKESLKLVKNEVIIADGVLLFQIFGNEKVFLIDLRSIGRYLGYEDIKELVKERGVVYLKKLNEINYFVDARANNAISILDRFDQKIVLKKLNNYSLCLIKTKNNE